jgi:hypothetical protein
MTNGLGVAELAPQAIVKSALALEYQRQIAIQMRDLPRVSIVVVALTSA